MTGWQAAAERVAARRAAAMGRALLGAALWGLSGTAAQFLFHAYHVEAGWLTSVRMLGAGALLWALLRPPFPSQPWRFVGFALFGFAAVQYTYLAAIAWTNVATATFLQYLGLPLIALYEASVGRRRHDACTVVALALAVGGTALLVLSGRGALRVTPAGLAMGIASALTMAYYTLASVPYVQQRGAWATATWGFLIGGAAMAVWVPPWQVSLLGSPWPVLGLTGFVVVFGTLFAFSLYLGSLHALTATVAGIAAAAEPVVAAVAALVFLHVRLHPLQYLGGGLIVVAVLLLHVLARQSDAPPRR
jgi:drug/metabolite transporter (DMT)-like permease